MVKNGEEYEPLSVTRSTGKPKPVDFVITNDGKLVIGSGHYNLANKAKSVKGAGGIKVIDGKVVEVTNESGHYKPNSKELYRQSKRLQRMGITSPKLETKKKF